MTLVVVHWSRFITRGTGVFGRTRLENGMRFIGDSPATVAMTRVDQGLVHHHTQKTIRR